MRRHRHRSAIARGRATSTWACPTKPIEGMCAELLCDVRRVSPVGKYDVYVERYARYATSGGVSFAVRLLRRATGRRGPYATQGTHAMAVRMAVPLRRRYGRVSYGISKIKLVAIQQCSITVYPPRRCRISTVRAARDFHLAHRSLHARGLAQ